MEDKKKELLSDVVIELTHPIKFGSETITSLKLRRPKAKDLRPIGSDVRNGDLIDLAARLSNQPSAVLDDLEIVDLDKVTGVVADFLLDGRQTGKRD